jgi:hypothetical protein
MDKYILPFILKPQFETELIRLGKNNDGGYLIPLKSLYLSNKLYSFGLSDDYSFEKDFFKKTNIDVICYDETVNYKLFLKSFLFGHFSKLFQYLGYRLFFNGKKRKHIKKNIIPRGTFLFNSEVNSADINSIIKEDPSDKLFFKIDIEGCEYRIMDQLIKHSTHISGLVIEFHDCDLNLDKIINFVKNFELQIVHIHVNNWGYISPSGLPHSLEITFSPKEFNSKLKNEYQKYSASLDQSNNPNFKNLPLEFN